MASVVEKTAKTAKNRRAAEPAYGFTLMLSGISEVTEEVANALYECGCDDGLFVSRDGYAFVDFERAADSYATAILTAIADVEKAGAKVGIKLRVSEVVPPGASEIDEINSILKLRRGVLSKRKVGEDALRASIRKVRRK